MNHFNKYLSDLPYRLKGLPIVIFILFSNGSLAQRSVRDSAVTPDPLRFSYKALIIPTVLIGYGTIGIESDQLKLFNTEIREEVKENIDQQLTIDDFSQYAPALSVYGLNALGIKGKHNFKDRTVILATSYLIMASSVVGLKKITRVERPDGSSMDSWPSGHTATAFMGAEFLWQEYKDVSIWYGITGYAIAVGTGAFRIYNDRHWFTDVAAGAGIGILSTKIAYWINPFIQEKVFGKKRTENLSSASLMPFHSSEGTGLGVVFQF
ncbi:MAG: phosphatase PAP2 family protein [Flavobacteriales bacterium]|nr:MAG: phosphatase PAP2 family protein [Flavobacteriales bacterium]